MSVSCHECPIADECNALPYGFIDCQDNAARFDYFAKIDAQDSADGLYRDDSETAD